MAFLEKYFAVRTFVSAYEEYQIVCGGKLAYFGHTVCHLPANGVIILESGRGDDMCLNVGNYFPEFIE